MIRKRWSRMLVSLLSAAMVISSGVYTTMANDGTVRTENNSGNFGKGIKYGDLNYVFNGDFSKDSNWIVKEGGNGSVNKRAGDNYYGSISQGTFDDYLIQRIDVEGGKNYKLTAKVKVDTPEEAVSGVFLVVKYGLDSSFKQLELSKTEGWQEVEMVFTPAHDKKSVIVGLVKWAESTTPACTNATVSIDDVFVAEEQLSEVVEKWVDDFNGNALDQEVWGYELGRIRGNEQQHYVNSKENVFVQDGNLILKATKRPEAYHYTNPSGGNKARRIIYNSGSVRTAGQKEFLYGRLEMRAKLPEGKGAFPAFWTLGADFSMDGLADKGQAYGWPTCGEIDIMEIIGGPTDARLAAGEAPMGGQSNKTVYGTPHFYWSDTADPDKDGSYGQNYDNATSGNATLKENLSKEYHIYGINWTDTKIEWYLDNEIYNVIYFKDLTDAQMQAAKESLCRPQYIQLNLATGGNWAGDAGAFLAEDNTRFIIDWVKWSQDSQQAAAAQAYYAGIPKLEPKLDEGNQTITVVKGQELKDADLLKYVQLNDSTSQYEVRFSIEDEYMFVNNGIGENGTGQTKVSLIYSSSSDRGKLQNLPDLKEGMYQIHYTAVPKATTDDITGKVTPRQKLIRKSLKLAVLPNALTGKEGEKLSTVSLPEGWSWKNPERSLDTKTAVYDAAYTNPANEGQTREVLAALPVEVTQ